MKKIIPVIAFLFLFYWTSSAQEVSDHQNYRTYSGAFNNLSNPEWGQAGENLRRVTRIGYDDGISSPAGQFRPNPRAISNAIFAQEEPIYDPQNISDFCWVFGQFIDHDIGLTTDNESEDISVTVPTGDAYFDPFFTGTAKIHILRNISDPTTGTSTANPRQQPNIITAFIDASAVYGSDPERANWLRTHEGGKLRTSSGNLLPFNTLSGEFEDEIDPNAPMMASLPNISEKVFVAGDIRANENTLLTAIHTLFMREHNRQCDIIAAAHPDWNDEQIYQHARKTVGAILQSIAYNEWLPTMGLVLEPYSGYKNDVNPQIMNVFSGAAYRLGHTQLSGEIKRLDAAGQVLPEGPLLLRDAYFNPSQITNFESIDPYFRGMGAQKEQMLDAKVVNDVRNFLFGPPGAGGLDLATINLQRGRDRGLPNFNAIRVDLGLSHISYFQFINDDPDVFNPLSVIYNGNINIIDPWVGFLAEKPLPNTIFGETLYKVMSLQFGALRDGDRFFYLNDPVLTQEEKDAINATTFRDVIMENTGVSIMQENVFNAMPHDEICETLFVSLSGNIHNTVGDNLGGVAVTVLNDEQNFTETVDASGDFDFEDIPGCGTQGLILSKNDDLLNGVTTFDLILIQKHILGIQPFSSPYKMLASDVDKNGSISTFDLIRLRQAILGIITEFPGNESWRFVPENFTFEEPSLILNSSWEGGSQFNGILSNDFAQNFIAVKIGDVNDNASTSFTAEATHRSAPALQLNLGSDELKEGHTYRTNLTIDYNKEALGYQFALNYDSDLIEVLNVEGGINFSTSDFVAIHPSQIAVSWNSSTPTALNNQMVLSIIIKANSDVRLSDVMEIDRRSFANEVYDDQLNIGEVNLAFNEAIDKDFYVAQNDPNPFVEATSINYYLPHDGVVTRQLLDATGKQILTSTRDENEGTQTWQINKNSIPTAGLYFYQISYDGKMITKRFVVQ